MPTRLLGRIAGAAIILLAAGCAQNEVAFDASQAGSIKTIAVVTPQTPSTPAVMLASSVGQSFGLIGALVDAGMAAHREGGMERLLAGQHFVAGGAMSQELGTALGASGYKVQFLQVPRPDGDYLKTYPPVPGGADAYLDVVVPAYGYMAAGIGSSEPYRPALRLKCRLVRASDMAVLMQETIAYNPLAQNGKQIAIAPDPDYAFPDFDALMADPPRTTQGMQVAFHQSAGSVAQLLHD